MKILQINKFLWLSGGVERYMFDLAGLLESRGHEVSFFAMEDVRNRDCAQSPYFVSTIDYKKLGMLGALRRASKIVSKTVYSLESSKKIRELIRDVKPDIAHIHSIDHQISPSILPALREEGVPIVQSVHDYKLICPNYRLYVPRTGEICERCLPGKYYHCVGQRCMKDSLAASALAAGAMYLHKGRQIYEKNVQAFLCSTQFLAAKLEEGGIPKQRIRHRALYLDLARYEADEESEDYAVYVGRLVPEKGLLTLLDAVAKIPSCKLVVVGDGESRDNVQAHARASGAKGVEFVGHQEGAELNRLIARSRFLVMPSEWYEPCGLVLWEAYALRRPVIAARIGGIPESVVDRETGLLFEPGNADDLAEKMTALFGDAERARAMGIAGRQKVEGLCEAHGAAIEAIYEEALAASMKKVEAS